MTEPLQLDLLGGLVSLPTPLTITPMPPVIHGDIQSQFELFHRLNPWVYAHIVRLTRELMAKGHRKVGMKMLFEVMRWQVMMTTADPSSDFKLNNNYHSRYARMVMERNADLRGIYEIRRLQSA